MRRAVLVLPVLAAMSAPLPAAPPPLPRAAPDPVAARVTAPVAVRRHPEPGAPVIARLPAGAVVVPLGPVPDSGWVEIRAQAGERRLRGYIPKNRLAPGAGAPIPDLR